MSKSKKSLKIDDDVLEKVAGGKKKKSDFEKKYGYDKEDAEKLSNKLQQEQEERFKAENEWYNKMNVP